MSNLTLFSGKGLPAHIANTFAELPANTQTFESVPQLSFRGKVWRVSLHGTETPILKDDEPVSSVRVIILDMQKRRSRAYYEGAYEEGKTSPPTCWSNDGITPDASIETPCAPTCAACPNSAKGSRITDSGKEVTACAQFKRVAVIPSEDVNFEPLLLRLPQTSLWDKENGENEVKGFFAFDQYLDYLRARGVNHTASVITKIRFDNRTAYPKLIFGAEDWLPAEHAPIVKDLLADPRVEALLKVNPVAESVPVTQAQPIKHVPTPTTTTAATAAAPAVRPSTPAAPPPAATPAVTPAAQSPAPPTPIKRGPGRPPKQSPFAPQTQAAAPAPTPAPAPKPAVAPAVEEVEATAGEGLGDLMSAWSDD